MFSVYGWIQERGTPPPAPDSGASPRRPPNSCKNEMKELLSNMQIPLCKAALPMVRGRQRGPLISLPDILQLPRRKEVKNCKGP